jgi:hypothetical protein
MLARQLNSIGVFNPNAHTVKHLLSRHPVSGRRMISIYVHLWQLKRDFWISSTKSIASIMPKHKHTKKCRRFCVWCFLSTVTFPLEHELWEKVPYISWFTLHVLKLS